jgi:hypothetical protein
MTTNKSHSNCPHPNTKSARAACRKARAKAAAEFEALMAPTAEEIEFGKMVEVRTAWETRSALFAAAHVSSAEINADDTSVEEGFEPMTRRWYEVALSTLESARDDAVRCQDASDPEAGQAVWLTNATDWQWVDSIARYENGWAKEIVVVDREGNRTTVPVTAIEI